MSINGDFYTSSSGQVYSWNGDNENCTVSTCPIELSVYGYRPSIGLSGALIALYAICIGIQIVQGWHYKTWSFMAAMALGCLDEILGYVGRILYWQNPWGNAGFIMQIVLITIGPVFFSAAIYVMLSQIVKYISPKSSRFRPNFFYYIFIPCDILSLILQAVGGAESSSSDGSSTSGVDIALAGLGLQVATLFFFVVAAVDYFIRSRSVWTKVKLETRFKVFMGFLTLATVTIFIRCCYRVYELSEGYSQDSKALRNQGEFIGLEAVMVIIAAFALTVAHPGRVFNRGQPSLDTQIDEYRQESKKMSNASESLSAV